MPSPAPRSYPHEHRDAGTGTYTVGVAVVQAPRSRSWWGRLPMRLFGGAGRMIGVDVARGLAVLGLVCGMLSGGGLSGGGLSGGMLSGGGSVLALATAALFVLVSGVSASLLLRPAGGGAGPTGGGAGLGASGGARSTGAGGGARSMGSGGGDGADGGRSAGASAEGGAANVGASLRVCVRAAVLFAAGGVIGAVSATGAVGGAGATGVSVPATMLQLLGALTFAALFVRRWRARTLFIAAAGCLLVLPAAGLALDLWVQASGPDPVPEALTPSASTTAFGPAFAPTATATAAVAAGAARGLVALLTGTAFPLLAWCAPFLAGLAIGRLPRDRIWRPFVLLAAGGLLFAAALAATLVAANLPAASGAPASLLGRVRTLLGSSLTPLLAATGLHPTAAPNALPSAAATTPALLTQQAGLLDVLGATSLALAVLALCLLAAKPLRWLVFPVAALGSTALTASTLLLAVVVFLPASLLLPSRLLAPVLPPGSAKWGSLLGAMVVWAAIAALASAWRAVLDAGPAERLVAAISRSAVAVTVVRASSGRGDSAVGEAMTDPLSAWPAGAVIASGGGSGPIPVPPPGPASTDAARAAWADPTADATWADRLPSSAQRDPEGFRGSARPKWGVGPDSTGAAHATGFPSEDRRPSGMPTDRVPGPPIRPEPTNGPAMEEPSPARERPRAGETPHRERRAFGGKRDPRQNRGGAPRRSSFGQKPVSEAPSAAARKTPAAAQDGREATVEDSVAAGATGGVTGSVAGGLEGPPLREGWPNPTAPVYAEVTPPPTPQWSPGQSLGRLPY